jgi:hypothetical protein
MSELVLAIMAEVVVAALVALVTHLIRRALHTT